VSDDQLFRMIWGASLLLILLPLVLPLARSKRRGLQMAAVWVLIGGFLFAFYRVAEWLLGSAG
jgi:hypothetical protein